MVAKTGDGPQSWDWPTKRKNNQGAKMKLSPSEQYWGLAEALK